MVEWPRATSFAHLCLYIYVYIYDKELYKRNRLTLLTEIKYIHTTYKILFWLTSFIHHSHSLTCIIINSFILLSFFKIPIPFPRSALVIYQLLLYIYGLFLFCRNAIYFCNCKIFIWICHSATLFFSQQAFEIYFKIHFNLCLQLYEYISLLLMDSVSQNTTVKMFVFASLYIGARASPGYVLTRRVVRFLALIDMPYLCLYNNSSRWVHEFHFSGFMCLLANKSWCWNLAELWLTPALNLLPQTCCFIY